MVCFTRLQTGCSWNRVAEEVMMLFAESGHPVFRATSLSSRGPLEKHRRRKNVEKLQRGLDDGRAFYFAASCPFISSVSTEPWRIGVKILLGESQLILHFAQETQLDMWTMTQSLETHPRTNRNLPNHPCSMWEPHEPRCSSTKRNSKTLQKIFNLSKLPMTLVGKELSHLDNSSLQFMTFSWKDFAARTHVESIHILEMITDPNQKELFEATPKLVQYWRSRSRDTLSVVQLKLRSVLCKEKRNPILDRDQQEC